MPLHIKSSRLRFCKQLNFGRQINFDKVFLFLNNECERNNDLFQNETSMMWPSQNFLLYNGTIITIKVNEWINN